MKCRDDGQPFFHINRRFFPHSVSCSALPGAPCTHMYKSRCEVIDSSETDDVWRGGAREHDGQHRQKKTKQHKKKQQEGIREETFYLRPSPWIQSERVLSASAFSASISPHRHRRSLLLLLLPHTRTHTEESAVVTTRLQLWKEVTDSV